MKILNKLSTGNIFYLGSSTIGKDEFNEFDVVNGNNVNTKISKLKKGRITHLLT